MGTFSSPITEFLDSLRQGSIIPDFPLHLGLLEPLFIVWQLRDEHVVRVQYLLVSSLGWCFRPRETGPE